MWALYQVIGLVVSEQCGHKCTCTAWETNQGLWIRTRGSPQGHMLLENKMILLFLFLGGF